MMNWLLKLINVTRLLQAIKAIKLRLQINLDVLRARYPGRYKVALIALSGAILVCLTMYLTSCTKQPTQQTLVKISVPEALTEPTPEPQLIGDTNKDLLTWALRLLEALRHSNADKAAIKEWSN